ncbi:MAG: hypothetical protein JWL77_3221 [Chthonomonadaceae bacterium]|nr:hypothetical protein [Chthonomonadaceae bacterium]
MGEVKRCGFTLVELLIVLAIAAVLAGLLAPVLIQARSQAQQDVCLSNVRQLGLAVNLYAADYDGLMPYAPDAYSKKAVTGGHELYGDPLDALIAELPDVRTLLKPYKANLVLYHCPSDHLSAQTQDLFLGSASWYQWCGSSYSYPDRYALKSYALAGFPLPAETMLFYDQQPFHHDERMGVAFVDMHVKAISWTEWGQKICVLYPDEVGCNNAQN